MEGSGMIRVLKRDGSSEQFDPLKLTSALCRAMQGASDRDEVADAAKRFERGMNLADAVLFYLSRTGRPCASSAAIFEMCVKVLQHVQMPASSDSYQAHHARRLARRGLLRVRHDDKRLTYFDKNWLAGVAERSWHLSPPTARTIAGQIEDELLAALTNEDVPAEVSRDSVIDMLNDRVSAYGLADAVPARL